MVRPDGIDCPDRCEQGWITVDDRTVRPCPDHRPAQWERWFAGEFLPTPWEWFAELEGLAA